MDGRRSAARAASRGASRDGGCWDDPPPPAATAAAGRTREDRGALCQPSPDPVMQLLRIAADSDAWMRARPRTDPATGTPGPRGLDTMAHGGDAHGIRRDDDHVVRARLRRAPYARRQGRPVRPWFANPQSPRSPEQVERCDVMLVTTATPTTPATRCRSPAGRGRSGRRSTSCSSGSTASTRRRTTSSA